MDLNTILNEIESAAGRKVNIVSTTYKGQEGFIPEYINFNFRSRVSEIFAPTELECAENFLNYLKSLNLGDEDGRTTSDGRSESDRENSSDSETF